MKWLGILVVLIVIIFLVEKSAQKFLGIKKQDISETPGKNIDNWGRTILLILFFVAYLIALAVESESLLKWLWFVFMIVLTWFQAILEWKYLKESNQYILTLISSTIIAIIIFFYIIIFYS